MYGKPVSTETLESKVTTTKKLNPFLKERKFL
jgi:hypothetical protein